MPKRTHWTPTLPELIGLLEGTGQGTRPMLWTLGRTQHVIPYKPDENKSQSFEYVRLDDGTEHGKRAQRVYTAKNTWCPIGSLYLVSDSYASCVPVMGVSKSRTYLAHINGFTGTHDFAGWEPGASILILSKTDAEHRAKAQMIYEYCIKHFAEVAIENMNWWGCTGVIAFRSTFIAYLEDGTPEDLTLSATESLAKLMAEKAQAKAEQLLRAANGAATAAAGTSPAALAAAAAVAHTAAAAGGAATGMQRMEAERQRLIAAAASQGGGSAAGAGAAAGGTSAAQMALFQSINLAVDGKALAAEFERQRLNQGLAGANNGAAAAATATATATATSLPALPTLPPLLTMPTPAEIQAAAAAAKSAAPTLQK